MLPRGGHKPERGDGGLAAISCLRLVKFWLWLSALATAAGWLLSAVGHLTVLGYVVFFIIAITLFGFSRKSVSTFPRSASLSAAKPPSVSGGFDRRSIFHAYRRRFCRPLPLSFVILSLLIFLGAILYGPNNHTALTYRTPRVLHWLSEGHWHWIHTANYRMNNRACGIEWLTAPLLLFTKSDRLLFLLNFIPFLMLPGLIFSVWTRLGVRPRVAWYWMWLMPTGYAFLLQAGSTGNDTFPTVYALAAIDFAFRARESHRFSDLAYSVLAAALLTGAKASNLPLLLPWAILVFLFFLEFGRGSVHVSRFTSQVSRLSPLSVVNLINSFLRGVLTIFKRHYLAAPAVLLLAALASFLPTAILNYWYINDWSGLSLERAGMNMKNPGVGVWGNTLILLFNNFLFTFFPFASWWNTHALTILPHAIVSPLVANFEDGFHIVGEIPTEEYAGIGFGISFLALISLLFQPKAAEDCAHSKTLRAGSSVPISGRLWSARGLLPLLLRLLLVAPWLSLAAYCMKSGMVTGARLIAPYYPLLFPLLLAGGRQSQIVRKRWWQALMWLVLLLALAVLVVTPARPLWPARTLLSRAVERHPNRRPLSRALGVYIVYGQRSDSLAQVRALLPADVSVVGFMGTEDDIEMSLWHPYFQRRVKHVLMSDSPDKIRERNIQYIVVGGLNLTLNRTTLDDWLASTGAELIGSATATLKLAEGPQPWYVVRLK
jgi:hypothetical protein